jgi:hypothetical protein
MLNKRGFSGLSDSLDQITEAQWAVGVIILIVFVYLGYYAYKDKNRDDNVLGFLPGGHNSRPDVNPYV